MTIVLVQVGPDTEPLTADSDVATARIHQPARSDQPGRSDDVCSACGWHWPCPAYFHARRSLIAAEVPPAIWAVR